MVLKDLLGAGDKLTFMLNFILKDATVLVQVVTVAISDNQLLEREV